MIKRRIIKYQTFTDSLTFAPFKNKHLILNKNKIFINLGKYQAEDKLKHKIIFSYYQT
jgi:hypothetical protein